MADSTSRIEQFVQALACLLPRGRLWDIEGQPVLKSLLTGLIEEYCRIDDLRIKFREIESDPRVTDEYLVDWERAFGLPDECTPEGQTVEERRNQLVQKLTDLGGISAAALEENISELGFEIEIEDARPFLAGREAAGDPLTNHYEEIFLAGQGQAGDQLRVYGWQYTFFACIPAAAVEVFEAGDVAGTPLVEADNPLITCTLRKIKPAHTSVFFKFI